MCLIYKCNQYKICVVEVITSFMYLHSNEFPLLLRLSISNSVDVITFLVFKILVEKENNVMRVAVLSKDWDCFHYGHFIQRSKQAAYK